MHLKFHWIGASHGVTAVDFGPGAAYALLNQKKFCFIKINSIDTYKNDSF